MPTITVTITQAQHDCVAERLAAGSETPPTVEEWVTAQVLANVNACASQTRAETLSKLGAITDADISAIKAARGA